VEGLNVENGAALVRQRLTDSIDVHRKLLESACVAQAALVAARIVDAFSAGGKVLFFGNGGSSMDAGHLAAEMLGRYALDRPALPAASLADHTAAVTAIGNDYGFDEVFARQVTGLGAPGDVLVGLTTSGDSPNVVRALVEGRQRGMYTVALTGAKGGAAAEVADLCLRVPAVDTPRVQEACLHLGHTICELVEAAMFQQPSAPSPGWRRRC
jgi:D-sedoheptulose 7-phosphate isomerase